MPSTKSADLTTPANPDVKVIDSKRPPIRWPDNSRPIVRLVPIADSEDVLDIQVESGSEARSVIKMTRHGMTEEQRANMAGVIVAKLLMDPPREKRKG